MRKLNWIWIVLLVLGLTFGLTLGSCATGDDDDNSDTDDDTDDDTTDDDTDDDTTPTSPCIHLNGVNEWGVVPEEPSGAYDTEFLTVECWFYLDKYVDDFTYPYFELISKEYWTSPMDMSGWYLRIHQLEGEPAKLNFSICHPAEKLLIFSNADIVIGTWYHVAVVYDGSEVRMYINGEIDSVKAFSNPILYNDEGIGIGRNARTVNPATLFPGMIDEIRISSIARYDDDFTPEFEFSDIDASTVALFHFNEGSGDIITDSSMHANHGILTDDDLWDTRSE